MAGRIERNKSHERITITVTSETKRKIEEIARAGRMSHSAIASIMLEERMEMEEVINDGGRVAIQDSHGNTVKQIGSFRRVKQLPSGK